MAADYSKVLGLDSDLYKKDQSDLNGQIDPAKIETMFLDGDIGGSKLQRVGASSISSGQLPPGEAITITDGERIRILIGYQLGGF